MVLEQVEVMIQSLSYKLLLMVLQWVWELKVWELKGWDYIIQVTVEDPWTGVRLALLFCIASVFTLMSFGLCLVFVLWISLFLVLFLSLSGNYCDFNEKMLNLFCLFLNWKNRDMSILWKLLWLKWKNEKPCFAFFLIRRIKISQFLWEI
jgi:hypothetical protein